MIEKINKYLAQFFSGVFNPFLIPSIGLFTLMVFIPGTEFYSSKLKLIIYLITFLSTCVIPLLFILILSLNPSFDRAMEHHSDRIIPYLFTAFSTFLGAQLIGKLPLPHPNVFRLFLLGTSFILIILLVVTWFWKISGHASGVGGLLGASLAMTFRFGIDITWIIAVLFVISGAVGTSRVYLKKHTPAQVYAGFSMSIAVMFSLVYFT